MDLLGVIDCSNIIINVSMSFNCFCFIIDHEYQLSIIQTIVEQNQLHKNIIVNKIKPNFFSYLQYKLIELFQLFESRFSSNLKVKTSNQPLNFSLSVTNDNKIIYINLTAKTIDHPNAVKVTPILDVIWKGIGKRFDINISQYKTIKGSYITSNTSFFITSRINNYIAATFDLIHYNLSNIKND